MSLYGVRTVAQLELKQRVRTSRWVLVFSAWFLLVAAVALLTWYGISRSVPADASSEAAARDAGRSLYDLTTFFVLGLSMLTVPSLTATSINSDREHGVLATLQTTLLSPSEIVLGKWVAALCVTLAFLATALPFLIWGWIAGDAGLGTAVRSIFVLVTVLAVICAIGLMFSTLAARPVGSAVLSYLTVAVLVVGTLIAFLLTLKPLETTDSVKVRTIPQSWYETHPNNLPTAADCTVITQQRQQLHTERSWWLLAMNPVVIVADASYVDRPASSDSGAPGPMSLIAEAVGSARRGPSSGPLDECWVGEGGAKQQAARVGQSANWPWGLGILAFLGAGALAVATRRTRTPVKRLPNGTRIA